MDIIVKAAAVGVVGAILAVTLREYKKEFALFIVIASGIVILGLLLESIGEIGALLSAMTRTAGINGEYVAIMAKIIVISYICEFAAQFCSDAGEKAIGSKIELAGRILILSASVPIIRDLFELITSLSF